MTITRRPREARLAHARRVERAIDAAIGRSRPSGEALACPHANVRFRSFAFIAATVPATEQ
jgi:hypothetical protein